MDQRLQILFKEYDALRAEILVRINNMFQILGVAGTLTVLGLPWLWSKGLTTPFWVSLGLMAVLLFGLWLLIHVEMARAAFRIREIEEAVNAIANAELLRWESRWGRANSWIVTFFINQPPPAIEK